MTILKAQVLLLLLLALGAPTVVHGKSEDEKLFGKSLKAAHKVWKDYVVDKDDKIMDYSYEYSQGGSDKGGKALHVDVRKGKVESAWPAYPTADDLNKPTPKLALIDDMFDEIKRALKDKDDTVNTVTFNDKYGYPESFSITYEDGTELNVKVENMVIYTMLKRELDDNMKKWNKKMKKMKDNDYKYIMQISCFCFGEDYFEPKQITVKNGVISDVTLADGAPAKTTEGYYTVPQLFDRIQNAIGRYYYEIDVTYDEAYGLPNSVGLNYNVRVADGSQNIEISDFVDLS